MQQLLDQMSELATVERLGLVSFALIRIVTIVLVAVITVKVEHRFIHVLRSRIVDMMRRHRPGDTIDQLQKRAATIGGIVRKTLGFVIWAIALVMIMREFNFDIAPILAGAGVVGLAVGFGAQNLVRDVITGLFMLVENQISVNDIAIVNGTGGLVEEINLRTTVLRGLDGTVHIFPNGAIATLSNMTHEFSYYVLDLGVAYKEDTDHVVAVLKDVSEEIKQTEEYGPLILEPLDVLGVDQFTDSAVIIKLRLKTIPMAQWKVGREMNRRIKKRFDREGIEMPFPHRTLHFGKAGMPFKLQLDGAPREELKQAVREVFVELQTDRSSENGS